MRSPPPARHGCAPPPTPGLPKVTRRPGPRLSTSVFERRRPVGHAPTGAGQWVDCVRDRAAPARIAKAAPCFRAGCLKGRAGTPSPVLELECPRWPWEAPVRRYREASRDQDLHPVTLSRRTRIIDWPCEYLAARKIGPLCPITMKTFAARSPRAPREPPVCARGRRNRFLPFPLAKGGH